jgi:Integrase core domain
MESINGFYKTGLIDRSDPETGRNEVERKTAAWVPWLNTERLYSALGDPAHRRRSKSNTVTP